MAIEFYWVSEAAAAAIEAAGGTVSGDCRDTVRFPAGTINSPDAFDKKVQYFTCPDGTDFVSVNRYGEAARGGFEYLYLNTLSGPE